MSKCLDLVLAPCCLYTGADGSITAGIRVRRLGAFAEVEAYGYVREYNVNTYSLTSNKEAYRKSLGLDETAFDTMVKACKRIELLVLKEGYKMIIEKSPNGRQIRFRNEAGQWIGWAGRVNGIMTLKATAEPLSNDERRRGCHDLGV